MDVTRPERLHQTITIFVAHPNRPHFSLPNQFIESLQGILWSHPMIGPVHLIEVDVVGLKALQASFHGLANVISIQSRLVIPDRRIEPAMGRPCHLCCNNHPIPWPVSKPLPYPGLAQTHQLSSRGNRIELRTIIEIDSLFKGPVHDPERHLLPSLGSKGHGSHAYLAYHDSTCPQSPLLHATILSMM